MNIIPYEPAMAGELTAAYNSMVAGVPHCYPIQADDLAWEHDGLRDQAVIVARDGRSILGFAHAVIASPDEHNPGDRGAIRFLCYERGQRAAGQALLEAAEASLRQRGMNVIDAFDQHFAWSFHHLEHAYLSDHLAHVGALLRFNGYTRHRGEVFLEMRDIPAFEPAAVDVDIKITVLQEPGRGTRPGLTLTATLNGEHIGSCRSTSVGERSPVAEAQDWIFTVWLGVEDTWQGKGIGRHLLQRALQEARGIGYRHAAISTSVDNHRALLFYSNHGYQPADWTYGYRRELD